MPCARSFASSRFELGLGADLGIDAARIDHVVAVRAAGPRLEERRGVDVADAEAREVRHQRFGVGEAELAAELQPVGGDRRMRRRAAARPCPRCAPASTRAARRTRAVGAPALQLERQLAAPVRVLLDAARQVRLLEQLEHVFRLHQGDLAGRAGNEGVRGGGGAVEAFPRQGARERLLVRLAQLLLALRIDRKAERRAAARDRCRPRTRARSAGRAC